MRNIAGMLGDPRINEVKLVEAVLSARGINTIADSSSAARKIHEMITSILDRIAATGGRDPHILVELASAAVLARYQAKRRLISECYADIVDYVVQHIADLIQRRDPAVVAFARRARLVFDALIVGIAGRR